MAISPVVQAALRSLEQSIGDFRRERDRELRIEISGKDKIDAEWPAVMNALRVFFEQAAADPNFPRFSVSRDGSEVSGKVRDAAARGGSTYLILSRRHPSDESASLDQVWLDTIPSEPVGYGDSVDAMRALIRRIVTST